MAKVRIHPEVGEALQRGAAVVALESAVITSGLPREHLPPTSRFQHPHWTNDAPTNLALAIAMQRTVRAAGAIPATIAVIEGDLCIGMDDDELVMLASDRCAAKASVTDLAHLMITRGSAGATVSATLAACALTQSQTDNFNSRINVFATGGIGGVHRDWQTLPDISADLRMLARTPVCVTCAGAKSILDLPATLESLETLGVPVLGYRTGVFPQFYSTGDDRLPVSRSVQNPADVAAICHAHWRQLHCESAVLLCHAPPAEYALPHDELEALIQQAERTAVQQHITGAARTPFLLGEIARLTKHRSLDVNLALLLNNAQLAAEVAVALAQAEPTARDIR